jgi:hypothetical protein
MMKDLKFTFTFNSDAANKPSWRIISGTSERSAPCKWRGLALTQRQTTFYVQARLSIANQSKNPLIFVYAL